MANLNDIKKGAEAYSVQVLLMSDELKLDEIHCLLCLYSSYDEVGTIFCLLT